jgi:hypothetical protein
MSILIVLGMLAAVVVIGIPLLMLAWVALLLIFRSAALLAVATIALLPVFGPWIILFNVILAVGVRAMCRQTGNRHAP